ncbi:EAL domain-containing protein [Pseudomonas sp.]|uniref:EAL domain-containing protein n=1 Tax=Pseudomonas sp. TaxID=306 RepID=UPI002726556F|nr:EAL domain-containing protein [Pseudomonas sp.]MDO8707072.1 EAL domain-containing protein [Pseudomonas sp.]
MATNSGIGKIIQVIFTPAIALLNRLSYTKKFTLLWLLSMIAIAVAVYSLFVSLDRNIHLSQRQLEGLELVKPISQAVQTIQLHRGLSVALLSGNETMRDRRANQEQKAAAAFKAMEGKLSANMSSGEDFRLIQSSWEQLRHKGLDLTVAENFTAHTLLIERLQLFKVFIADEYLLTLDPDLDTYYLIDTAINKLPFTLERLGQIRAYGSGILARKQLTELQKTDLGFMVAELEKSLKSLRNNLDKVGRYNPTVHKPLMAVSDDIGGTSRQISSLVVSDILTGRFATPPGEFMAIATAAIDSGYAQMHDSLLPMAESLVKARIAESKNTLYASTGIALLAFLVVVYFSVSMYYAIIGNIQSLARSARAFADGNLNTRIKLDTHDELNQVGDSFNDMADGFNAMLKAHREDEERLRATIETAMDAVVQMNAEGIITGWNSQAENIFGWTREEAIGQALHHTIIPPQYREAHVQGLKHFLLTGEGPALNSRLTMAGLHRDGREFPIELSIAAIEVTGKTAKGFEFSAFIRDITKKKESDELIWKQANFDTLTGLPNRRMFHDRLEQDVKKAHRANLKTALLFIDLDKFKEVNDALGHGMGDTLLKEAARRISECVRETDTVARLGGDEFTVILAELGDTSSVERVAEDIRQSLFKPFQLGNEITYISASIGITLHPDDAAETENLLKNADQAMYAAKNKGSNRFEYFTQSMQQAAQARLRLTNELRGALAAGQFRVYYQPIVNLATGHINKAEALIRWQHPVRGIVGPVEFIPLTEETGLIVEIGDWIFKESARQLKLWRTSYNAGFQISVNVSPVQLCNTGSLGGKAWFSYLQGLDLPGKSMVVEITEGLLLGADSDVTSKLLEFRDAGIQSAIDDFGTGYSSLSYLKKFDIDYLKIDQSFVRDLTTDPDDRALSEAIIVMAHKLGLKVIAEGVETEAQRKLLAGAGCDHAQGYLFSRPVPAEKFEELLKSALTRGL